MQRPYILRRPFFLLISVALNLVLAGALISTIIRLGGWRYAIYRLRLDETGLYAERKSLYQVLPDKPGAIVLLGDSQIEHCEWRELFGDTLPVLNRGISGDHVDGIWARLDDVLRNRPCTVILCVGVNDLLFEKPVRAIVKRYEEIVARIRLEAPEAKLLLISILPVNNEVKHIGLDNAEIRALNERIVKIANDNQAVYIDLHPKFVNGTGNLLPEYTDDGIHMNGAGYLIWKNALEPFLSTTTPQYTKGRQ